MGLAAPPEPDCPEPDYQNLLARRDLDRYTVNGRARPERTNSTAMLYTAMLTPAVQS